MDGRATRDRVLAEVNSMMGHPPSTIFGHARTTSVTRARHLAVLAVRRAIPATELSSVELGRLFCRDHSTILTTIRKMEGLVEADEELARDLDRLVAVAVEGRSVGARLRFAEPEGSIRP